MIYSNYEHKTHQITPIYYLPKNIHIVWAKLENIISLTKSI